MAKEDRAPAGEGGEGKNERWQRERIDLAALQEGEQGVEDEACCRIAHGIRFPAAKGQKLTFRRGG